MAIPQMDLRRSSIGANKYKRLSPYYGQRTGFLCHSHRDHELAIGLQEFLYSNGLDLYIDWQDPTMPEKPSAETADRLKRKIKETDVFLFLATSNSMSSRWCPWELGVADSSKERDQIIVVPTSDGMTTFGNEYLDLYRRIDRDTGGLGVYRPNTTYYASAISSL